MGPKPLNPDVLMRRADPSDFNFSTTDDLPEMVEPFGQERALDAIRFGAGIEQRGYNIFVTGMPSSGKHLAVRGFLEALAQRQHAPCDWAYAHNFKSPQQPRVLRLETGMAPLLRDGMAELIDDLKTAIPAVFESEEYRQRRQGVDAEVNAAPGRAFELLGQRAEGRGIALLNTPNGPAMAPMRLGKVLTPEEFNELPESERDTLSKALGEMREELQQLMMQVPRWEKLRRDRIRQLNGEFVRRTVTPLMADLADKLKGSKSATQYLGEVKDDIIEHIELFLQEHTGVKSGEGDQTPIGGAVRETNPFWRYQINVIVSNDARRGAPVVYEPHPTMANLVGRIEMVAQMGTLVTDFTRIRAGALHRAAGGFLMLNAADLLSQPLAWEALKRALRREQVVIEPMERIAGYTPVVTLEPEPTPLSIKIVLVGDRMLYYMLRARDADFDDLFKVQADFSESVERDAAALHGLAQLCGAITRRSSLRPLDPSGAARMAEFASREAGDAQKLSILISPLADLLREADYFARQSDRPAITAADIEAALAAQEKRSDRPRELYLEGVVRGQLLIDTASQAVGQINGLSVVDGGTFGFGRPQKITARVRPGQGQVIDIEREVALGGKLHSKGVLILSGYLASHYGRDLPLSLSASLVFEQSYGGVDGDSASTAELIVLLSAIAEIPLKQSFAITGAINQQGQVQAIGGVNEKIEGFFEICRQRGLSGQQGVIIPQSNVQNLMLKRAVVEAVRAGQFAVYAVSHADEAIALLTGMEAGQYRRGRFPAGSFNAAVAARIRHFARTAKRRRIQT